MGAHKWQVGMDKEQVGMIRMREELAGWFACAIR